MRGDLIMPFHDHGHRASVSYSPQLSSGSQWLGRRLTVGWSNEKLGDVGGQRGGKPVENIDRCIVATRFDAADRASVNPRVNGKMLLTKGLIGPQSAQVPADTFASLHSPQPTNLPPLNPSNISDILNHSTGEGL